MSTYTLKVMVPRQSQAPRGAAPAAVLALRVSQGLRSILDAMIAAGERRADNELHRLARQYEGFDPERARMLRAAIARRTAL